MPRESAAEKGRRYLAEGRLRVERVHDGMIVAACRGDGEVYRLGYDVRRNQWRCACPAATPNCAHLVALRLVVVRGDGA